MTRIAAVADVHVGTAPERLLPHYADVAERADALLVGGDLTQHGLLEEVGGLARGLGALGIPVVTVLGNHDFHQDRQGDMRRLLEEAGVRVLEGESVVLRLGGLNVGIAGVKGFCGGFGGSSGAEFGEREMKAFIRTAKVAAEALFAQLASLRSDVRIALTHYAPSRDTLAGEKLELYPFLGSYLLGEAIDRAGCDLALHGHAHHGTERGLTAGGIPVRNVAMPVIQSAYNVYELGSEAEERTPPSLDG